MKKEIDPINFEKGEAFENFIQNTIFTKDKYDLIHRTNDYKQNKERYSEDTKKPDFKFRCKNTGQEFYVEAKYRSKFNANDKLSVLDIPQFNRFKELNKSDSPVLVAIGYEGTPANPNSLSLLHINEIEYRELFRSVLQKHQIDKSPLANNLLIGKILISPASSEIIQQNQENVNQEKIDSNLKLKKSIVITLAVIAILFISIYFIKSNSQPTDSGNSFQQINNSQTEKEIKTAISNYYQTIESNNIEALDYYISKHVDRWYSRKNISLIKIKKETDVYTKKYPYRNTKIDWNSFNYTILPNGDYNVSYNIDYKIKSNQKKDFKNFHLKIKAIWTKHLKIKSLYEEKLD